jgi:beta-N-acetylhexosaminidase
LFSNATDLAVLYQMMLNGGSFGGKRYLKKETIDWFTTYQTPISRRGLGFDKPEKNNAIRTVKTSYPAQYVSSKTYGHTGFTGTCVWVDPVYDLVYIFLSNRVNPEGGDNRKLLDLNIRSRIQDIVYESLEENKNIQSK